MTRTVAGRLRRQATGLRQSATELDHLARVIEEQATTASGMTMLTGPEAVAKLAEILQPDVSAHYQELYALLIGSGFDVRGEQGEATLLAAIHRDPGWERAGRGIWRRLPS